MECLAGEHIGFVGNFFIHKFYFDSFGVQPPNELIEYLSSPIFYNTEKMQPDGEVICGHLCLYVLYRLSRGEGFQEIINDLYQDVKIIK